MHFIDFNVKVYKTTLFVYTSTKWVHVWYDESYWSKILYSTIPNALFISRSSSQTWNFHVKDFKTSYDIICSSYMFWYGEIGKKKEEIGNRNG